MLTIRSQTTDLRRNWTRRDVLSLSASLAPLALASHVPGVGNAAGAGASFGRAKACIFIYLYGGPSHVDIWDLKPDAPADVRGEFRPIATKTVGLQLTEHLPKLAVRSDKLAVIRSLTHESPSHGSAALHMLTGHVATQHGEIAPTPNDYPQLGSVIAKRSGPQRGVPPFAALPWQITTQVNLIPGQDAGFLDRSFNPLRIKYDDEQGNRFLLPDPGALQAAMAIERESDETRDRYGRNVFGQSMLLARRLVESGVRVVNVFWPDRKDEKALFYNGKKQPVSVPMWDTHGTGVGDTANFSSLKNRLLPPLDLASSALLDDLAVRGMLDDTLLVWTGEFGRTPRVQGDGRGHYSRCFSSMLAGGGVRGGIVHGASDATASAPTQDPVTPGDFFATMYHLLGIPADEKLPTSDNQSRPLVKGKVIEGLLA